MRPIGAATPDGTLRDVEDDGEAKREKAFSELVLPEMLASCMANANQPMREMSALALESATSLGEVAETWRPRGGALTGWAANGPSACAASGEPAVEGKLVTHIDAGELGKISVVVERTNDGMRISLGLDNPLTAATATMQRSALEQSLRASGLGVVKVTIARQEDVGTELAQSPYAPTTERWRKRLNLTG